MKKFLAMLLALVMALSLVACGEKKDDTKTDGDTTATGSVYYLNFKPESDNAWKALAATYTEKTGVPVKILTAASGEYESTLVSEMDKEDAPTLFQCNEGGVATWGEFCYDLSSSDVYNQLTSKDYALKNADGEVISIGYCLETYGIIVNKALLKEAGYEVTDITNFESLKKIADDIHSRAAELGFDAFTSAGLDGSSAWRFSGHLANMPLFYEFRDEGVTSKPATIKGTYLDNYKAIWDLYITDSATTGAALLTATGDQAEAEFGEGKAVFYQNGTWEYSNLTGEKFGMNADDLTMIPIYCGVEGEEKAGLCTGTENYWSVNKNASEEDIKATLDFLNWVVTSEEGTAMMAEQFGACPFQASKAPSNPFSALANEYVANGCYPVTWAFNYTPAVNDWRAAVVDALGKYTADGGSWDDVKTAFVEGWATQYNNDIANG